MYRTSKKGFNSILAGFVIQPRDDAVASNLFSKPAPEARFLYMIDKAESIKKYDFRSGVDNSYIGDAGTYLSQTEKLSTDYFPTYIYHSTLSTIFASSQHVIKASPFGRYRMFIHRELEIYQFMMKENAKAESANQVKPFNNILDHKGSFKTPDSTFICLEKAETMKSFLESMRKLASDLKVKRRKMSSKLVAVRPKKPTKKD